MSQKLKSAHVTPPDGNVFLDLGFEPALAAALLAESKEIIAEKTAAKDMAATKEAKGGAIKKP